MKSVLRFLRLIALLLCMIALSACDEPPPEKSVPPPPILDLPATGSPFQLGKPIYNEQWGYYELDYGSFPLLDGCDSCLPLARAFAKFHLGFSGKNLNRFIVFTEDPIPHLTGMTFDEQPYLNEQDIYMREKPTDLVLSTPPNEADYKTANDNGIELLVEPIAMDAVVLYVSPENPVNGLTSEQIRGIYSGSITNWNEVGGDDLPIIAYQNGTFEAKKALNAQVMQGDRWMEEPSVESTIPSGIPGGDSYTVSHPAKYQNTPESLGFGLMISREEMKDRKLLSIDGILPETDNLQSGAYPLSVTYNAILRAQDQDGVGGNFLDWILSDEGRQCILDAGYVLPGSEQVPVSP